jgi:hypothetical protein
MGNNGSIPSDKTMLMSGLNVGDKITVNGMYLGRAGDDSFAGSFISSLPSLTPVVDPIGGNTGLVVNSAGTLNNGTWVQIFSYANTSGTTKEEYSDVDVPSFTVDSPHWRIRWQVKNNDTSGINWDNSAWLTYQQNDADHGGAFIFNQKVSEGYSASGTYDGTGVGTYFVDFNIGVDATFNFVVEELK